MQKHLTVKTIEDYRKRLLSAEELLAMDDHVAVCAACRRQIGALPGAAAASFDLIADLKAEAFDHPDYEQFAAYVDGQLTGVDRECLESHIACCAPCSDELRDLRTVQEELTSRLSTPANFAPPVEAPQRRRPGWREALAARWRAPWFRLPLQVAAAAACLALVAWVTTLPLRRELADLRSQLAQAEQRNEDLRRDYEIARAESETLQGQITLLQPEVQMPPPSLAIALEDGSVKVDAQGNVAGLETLSSAYQQAVTTALGSGQVKTSPAIGSLMGRAGVLMGGAKDGVAFSLFSPVGTAVSSVRPTFRWRPLSGATEYSVTVVDEDFNIIARSPLVTSTTWTTSEALERGRIYSWTVTAIKDGQELKSPLPPAPEARFKVLEKDRVDEVVRARKEHGDSRLIVGVVYAQAGLLDEAEREFQLLARANPTSEVARKLLRSVRTLRGR